MTRLTAPGWRALILALVGALVIPTLPTALRSIAPVTETWVILSAALAICAALGWWQGGGAVAAGCAVVLAAFVGLVPVGVHGSPYSSLVHGWAFLLAGAFGVASLLTPGQGFFTRAITAVGIATAASFALAIASPGALTSVRSAVQNEYQRRTDATIAGLEAVSAGPEWQQLARRFPSLDSTRAENESQLRALPATASGLTPALVGLESLALLALAWALYHRVAGIELGPNLGVLRDFKFNDQLIWGLAVGATIYFIPAFEDGKTAGLNLLVFFGALFLIRGIGVLSWVSRGKLVGAILVALTILYFPLAAALALGVGVGDTWMNWRSRAQPSG